MELQIRDKRDPFTQALGYLLKQDKDAVAFKQKLRQEMIPLVTQVAVKIGAIVTEKSVRDQALEVFTGVISLHLAHTSVAEKGDLVVNWVEEIRSSDLELLFRKGFTLIDELLDIDENQVSFSDWFCDIKRRKIHSSFHQMHSTFLTQVEHLVHHATSRDETGLWIGYQSLRGLFDTKERFEYIMWLIGQAGAEKEVEANRGIYYDPDIIANRIATNLMLTGKVTLAMDYPRVERVITAAYGQKRWLATAKARYRKFLKTAPEHFQRSVSEKGENIWKSQVYFWEMVNDWPKKKLDHRTSIENLCLAVAVNSPYAKVQLFDPEADPLKDYKT
jgi:hypothetical protein